MIQASVGSWREDTGARVRRASLVRAEGGGHGRVCINSFINHDVYGTCVGLFFLLV